MDTEDSRLALGIEQLVALDGDRAQAHELAVMRPHLIEPPGQASVLKLPYAISPLVQFAYEDVVDHVGIAPQEWGDALDRALEIERAKQVDRAVRARAFLLDPAARDGRAVIGWVDAGVGEADDSQSGKAQVRDTGESLEVLVARRHADGTMTTVPWLAEGRGGLPLPADSAPEPEAARALAASGLRLPYQFTVTGLMIDRTIAELESYLVEAWQTKDAHWIAGELVLFLNEDNRAELAGHRLHYTESDGLEVTRAE